MAFTSPPGRSRVSRTGRTTRPQRQGLIVLAAALFFSISPSSPRVDTTSVQSLPADPASIRIQRSLPSNPLVDLSTAFGFDYDSIMDSQEGRDTAVRSGIRWLRQWINWREIQPTRDSAYEWEQTDQRITQAVDAGLQPIVLFAGSPSWAAIWPQGPVSDTVAMGAFLHALVERYDGDGQEDAPGSPVVRYWELFNEPDSGDYQAAIDNRAAAFGFTDGLYTTNILMNAYAPIKSADPLAQIALGGVAHDYFTDDPTPGVFDRNFITDTLAAGGCAFFGVMNFHSYPYYDWRWNAYGGDVSGKAAAIRAILANHGCSKPVMITEIGHYLGDPFDRQAQANYVVQGLTRAISANIYPVVWYRFRDIPGADRGLVDPDLAPYPGYDALQVLVEQMAGASFERVAVSPITHPSPTGREGYVFRVGPLKRYVLWTTYLGFTDTFPLPALTAQVTTRDGAVSTVADCDDGRCDGQVSLVISNQPIYVDVWPGVYLPSLGK